MKTSNVTKQNFGDYFHPRENPLAGKRGARKRIRKAAGREDGYFSLVYSALFTNNAGFPYYKMEKFEEFVTWFKKSIEIAPKRGVAYLNLGDAFVKLNRNSEARQAYTKYVELAPNANSAPVVKKRLDALPPSP